jgi:hypothetical protein
MTTIMQALSFKTERDLVLIIILSVLLILVIVFFPNAPVRIILGLPFVLFFTGYVSICALFPRKEELDIIERLAFSTGLSIAITPLIGLVLNYTPFGIRVYSVMFSLFSFILLVSIVAIYRRRKIASPCDVFTPSAADRNKGKIDSVENSNEEVRHEVKSETRFLGIFFQKIKPEYIALPLFVAISLFVYHQKYFSYIFMVIAAAIGVLLFIIFNSYIKKEEKDISFELPEDKSHTFRLATSILFFIFYGLSFLTLLQGFYTKTVWYYVFISLCVGIIAIEILFVKTKTQGTLNLIKSFLLVLNITLSNQILFSYGIGLPDLSYHLGLLFPIVNNGYVPQRGGYEHFPCHHIFATANILTCGSDPKMTYLYLGGFVICLGMLFVFLIGREFINLQFGLFAALMYTCLDYLIMYGSHPEHQAYNYFFSIVLFAVILYIYKKSDPRFVVFYSILVTTIVFTHHYSAMIILIVLSSLILVEIFQRIKESDYKFRFPGLAQIYVVILFAQWMYYSNMMGSFTGILDAYINAFAKGAESVITATAYDQLPIGTLFLNTLGSSILIVLSVIGFLYFFKNRSFSHMVIMMTTVILSILLGLGVVFKQQGLLADRMYPFLQLLGLVFLGSAGVIWLVKVSNVKIKQKGLKLVPIVAIVLCLSFFSLSSTIAGFETSLFVDEHTAYTKIYGTSQESYFDQWKAYNIENKYLFSMDTGSKEDLEITRITEKLEKEFESKGFELPEKHIVRKEDDCQWLIINRTNMEPWYIVIKEKEKERLNAYDITNVIDRVPITKDGSIDVQNITENSFVIFNKFYLITGFAKGTGGHLGQYEFIRIKEDKLYMLDRCGKYYDNGMVDLYSTCLE